MALACVLDASAAVRLILADPAAADLAERVGGAAMVLAPELMLTQLANTLWKLQRGQIGSSISTLRSFWPRPWRSPATSTIRSTTVSIWPWPGGKRPA